MNEQSTTVHTIIKILLERITPPENEKFSNSSDADHEQLNAASNS